jgi:hypothetical protein
VAVKVDAGGAELMVRIITIAVLCLATAWSLVVIAFLWAVTAKGEISAFGLLAAFALGLAAMWFAFSRGRHLAAVLIAAIPVGFTIAILWNFHLRMF